MRRAPSLSGDVAARWLCAALAVASAPACNGKGSSATTTSSADAPGGARPQWTLLIYGQADSNIGADFYDNLREMSQAQLSPDVNAIVMVDWNASRPNPHNPEGCMRTHSCPNFPTGLHWLRVRGGGQEAEELAALPEADSASPDTLRDAVERTFKRFPAQRYGVILWDHGGSWNGGYGMDQGDGTQNPPSNMSYDAAIGAVRAGLTAAGVQKARPLDLFSFDTCLMGGAEVAYEARDLAQVYIANGEIDYGAGNNYRELLTDLSAHPEAPMVEIAKREVAGWNKRHATQGASDGALRSHVALDLTRFDAFAAATRGLVDAALARGREGTLAVAIKAHATRPEYGLDMDGATPLRRYRDLGQLFALLERGHGADPIGAAAAKANAALHALVIDHADGDLRRGVGQAGLHVELPLPSTYAAMDAKKYATLGRGWATATRWRELLDALTPGDAPPPQIQVTAKHATGTSAKDPVVIETRTRGAVAEVMLEVMRKDGNGRWENYGIYGISEDLAPDVTLTQRWRGNLVGLPAPNGAVQPVTMLRFMSQREDPGTHTMRPALKVVPGRCAWSAKDAGPCSLIMNHDDAALVAFILDQTGSRPHSFDIERAAKLYPDATFTPFILSEDADGHALPPAAGQPTPIGRGMHMVDVPATAGQYDLKVQAYDVFGRRMIGWANGVRWQPAAR